MIDSESYKIRNASHAESYQWIKESVFMFRIKHLKTGVK